MALWLQVSETQLASTVGIILPDRHKPARDPGHCQLQ